MKAELQKACDILEKEMSFLEKEYIKFVKKERPDFPEEFNIRYNSAIEDFLKACRESI